MGKLTAACLAEEYCEEEKETAARTSGRIVKGDSPTRDSPANRATTSNATLGDLAPGGPGANKAITIGANDQDLVARRLIVADAGQSWLDNLFHEAREEVVDLDSPAKEAFDRWLDYKRRSVALNPGSWIAFFSKQGAPIGISQGASVARVYHNHFFYLRRDQRRRETVAHTLARMEEFARRLRCHTISSEGPNTGAIVKTTGIDSLIAAGFTWHERLHLGIHLSEPRTPYPCPADFQMAPLRLKPEDVTRLMQLEHEAFLHAACDHPGELPKDFSDGYRTTLLPMQSLSAIGLDSKGIIRAALYAEGKGDVAWIHTLFVEPEHRNQGLAHALTEHCLHLHSQANFARTELNVLAANTPAVHLYQNIGFQEIKRVDLFIKKLD